MWKNEQCLVERASGDASGKNLVSVKARMRT